ncbi:hypothetical protein FIBSPDRAFT_957374 [Athelia psychrophila]|uniref:Ricin B lectin domain-containing protein n=1 Tax=Athelia psychrophila TaxID=1759441 RepID=A0A166FV37_9AGAM|nr:hypothetical protein FIBSPDRAFT_957374 [Fibularhizoctonia sp. CBS 109695]
MSARGMQVTGVGDLAKINVKAGDEGGELDPRSRAMCTRDWVRTFNNAKCLRPDNTNGAPVTVKGCTGGTDQEWKEVGAIGDTERDGAAWCTMSARGMQVTGVGDLAKINVKAGDEGGELDPHGSNSTGNPVGGLVVGNTFSENLQYAE